MSYVQGEAPAAELRYLDLFSLRLYFALVEPPNCPCAVWSLYSISISEKFSEIESTGSELACASPLVWKDDTSKSVNLTVKYSC